MAIWMLLVMMSGGSTLVGLGMAKDDSRLGLAGVLLVFIAVTGVAVWST